MLASALEVVASMVPRIEAERRLPREVVDALVAAGVFKLMVPRHLRDVQVVAQHIMVGSLVTTTIGRVLLDIESDTSTL